MFLLLIESVHGSISPDTDLFHSFSDTLLNSINIQLLRPAEISNNQTRLIVHEELWKIYTALGSGDWSVTSSLEKADLLNNLASFSSLMYHYTESMMDDLDGLNLFGLKHLANLTADELHALWFSVQGDSNRFVHLLLHLVSKAIEFVTLHIEARESNSSYVMPQTSTIKSLPLFLFPRNSTVFELGSGVLMPWFAETGWFSSQASGPNVTEHFDTIVCLESCLGRLTSEDGEQAAVMVLPYPPPGNVNYAMSKKLQNFMKMDNIFYLKI